MIFNTCQSYQSYTQFLTVNNSKDFCSLPKLILSILQIVQETVKLSVKVATVTATQFTLKVVNLPFNVKLF